MKLDVTSNDIVNCYRISGSKGFRPVVVTFSGKGVRDKVYEAKNKTLRGTRGNARVYVNEHLTKRNSEIFAKGRKLLKEKKLRQSGQSGMVQCFSKGLNLRGPFGYRIWRGWRC